MKFRIYTNGQPSDVFTCTLDEAQDRARTLGGRLFEKCGKFWHFTGFDGATA